MASEKARDSRGRNFATVVYPESAPENWQQILAESFVPAFISPLHDRDENATGEPKKPHYHVVVMFDGKKSEEQVRELFKSFGGVGLESVKSIRGYARYLCHLDNPEKAQYSPEDVRSLCGADYTSTIGLAIDKYKAIEEMMDYIDQNRITSYAALQRYARSERRDWFRVLCDSSTMVIVQYIKSCTWEGSQPGQTSGLVVDPDTGEVL